MLHAAAGNNDNEGDGSMTIVLLTPQTHANFSADLNSWGGGKIEKVLQIVKSQTERV